MMNIQWEYASVVVLVAADINVYQGVWVLKLYVYILSDHIVLLLVYLNPHVGSEH